MRRPVHLKVRLGAWSLLVTFGVLCASVSADKIVLTTGETVTGTIQSTGDASVSILLSTGKATSISRSQIRRTERDVIEAELTDGRVAEVIYDYGANVLVRFSDGKQERVPKWEIRSTRQTVVVEGEPEPSGAEMAPAVAVPSKVVLPSLGSVVSEMLAEILPERPPVGVVAEATEKGAYVSLGSSDGLSIGDELEVREPAGAVIGSLRITSTQPHLALCERVSGSIVQRTPTGTYCEVGLAEGAGLRDVSLGQVQIEGDAAVRQEGLAEALEAACEAHPRLRLASAEAAQYELRASARAETNGCTLALALLTGHPAAIVGEAKRPFIDKVSAAQIGLGSALCARLPAAPRMDAAEVALRQRFGAVHTAGTALYVPSAGTRGERGWVLSDGGIIVAHSGELSERDRLALLEATWMALADCCAGVTAAIDKEQIAPQFRSTLQTYTRLAGQHQFMYVVPRLSYDLEGYVLDCPQLRPSWAWFQAHGSYTAFTANNAVIDGRELPKLSEEFLAAEIASLAFGEHRLGIRLTRWLRIDAFHPSPPARIGLRALDGSSVITREALSAELSSLLLPACDAYCEWQ